MNKKVLIGVADGTEELEAVTIIDVLRRAEIDVTVASVAPGHQVTCSRGVQLVADVLMGECVDDEWDAVLVPGGMPGAQNLSDSEAFVSLLKRQHQDRKTIGAICAAPYVVLACHGLLEGKSATAYPGFREELKTAGVTPSDEVVVIDDHVITSQGPGTAMQFALAVVTRLCGEEVSHQVADGLLV